MRFLIAFVLGTLLMVSPAKALDFTNETGRDLERNKGKGVTVGASYRGFRAEAYAQTWNQDQGLLGWNLYAPVLHGDTISLRIMGGGYHYAEYDLRAHYKVGIEMEYMLKKDRSWIVKVSNKFDPWTGTFGTRPQFFTGARFYF